MVSLYGNCSVRHMKELRLSPRPARSPDAKKIATPEPIQSVHNQNSAPRFLNYPTPSLFTPCPTSKRKCVQEITSVLCCDHSKQGNNQLTSPSHENCCCWKCILCSLLLCCSSLSIPCCLRSVVAILYRELLILQILMCCQNTKDTFTFYVNKDFLSYIWHVTIRLYHLPVHCRQHKSSAERSY